MTTQTKFPVGYEEALPRVHDDLEHPGVEKAIYVAPLWTFGNGRKRVTAERLTAPLPADGSSQRYYGRKGYRLATKEDMARIEPDRFRFAFDEDPEEYLASLEAMRQPESWMGMEVKDEKAQKKEKTMIKGQ